MGVSAVLGAHPDAALHAMASARAVAGVPAMVFAHTVPLPWWIGVGVAVSVAFHGCWVAWRSTGGRPGLGGVEIAAATASLAVLGGAGAVGLAILAVGAVVVGAVVVASGAPGAGAPGLTTADARRRWITGFLAVVVAAGTVLVGALVGALTLARHDGSGVAPRHVALREVATVLLHDGAPWLAAGGLLVLLVVLATTGGEET